VSAASVNRPVIREQIADNYPTVELSSILYLTCPTSLAYCDVSLRARCTTGELRLLGNDRGLLRSEVSVLQRLAAMDLDLRQLPPEGSGGFIAAIKNPREKALCQRRLIMPVSNQAYEAGAVAAVRHSARHRVRPPLTFAGARKCCAYHYKLSRSRSFWQMPDPDVARNYMSAVQIDV
jgi:hypothetical protein